MQTCPSAKTSRTRLRPDGYHAKQADAKRAKRKQQALLPRTPSEAQVTHWQCTMDKRSRQIGGVLYFTCTHCLSEYTIEYFPVLYTSCQSCRLQREKTGKFV